MEQKDKRKTSVFIPFKIKENKVFVYLQRRSKDARILPDDFAFFGGAIEEGETPEQALVREVKEELDFVLNDFMFLDGRFEYESYIMNVFFAKVDDTFDSEITVLEGQYGKWFEMDDALNEVKMTDSHKDILKSLLKKLQALGIYEV